VFSITLKPFLSFNPFMKNIFVLLFLFFVGAEVQAQNAQNTNSAPLKYNIISPSPTAAALGKYGDIPVAQHTGVPNISIPLYTIQSGELQMPISLSYHSSGVKVEEEASWVGLGWSLNAGGVITRTMRGLPDEVSQKVLSPVPPFNLFADPVSDNPNFHYSMDICDGFVDTEPDIFYFNVNGKSGKFFDLRKSNANLSFALTEWDNLKIEYANSSTRFLASFILTDSQGINTKITINLRKKTPQRYGETQSYTKNSVFLRASPYLCVNFWRILNFILV
jgi:hypothetical protein